MCEIKKIIKKKYYIPTYSGTLAIELALRSFNFSPKSKVLVSSAICSSIIETIIRLNLTPVIIIPKNHFTLNKEEIINATQNNKISCIILVHQYGIGQKIKEIKKTFPSIPIIEDIAQAWDIKLNRESQYKYSDIIITSYGKTKPLSLGIGGGVFSDKKQINIVDLNNNESREKEIIKLPYYYSNKINYKKLINKANKIVKYQKKISLYLNQIRKKEIEIIKEDGEYVYHRFPLIIDNQTNFEIIKDLLEKSKVKYQLPHKKETFELKQIRDNSIILGERTNKKIIYIRTRQNNKKQIKKFIKLIERKL